ncbi:cytochrome P450 2G1-like [Rhinatrema bivittatum]|uniref:cytochrome P450 2G1-like n=1 Tax=Rhinatrema bivittatum TaxID=194408 RepID=UPI00112E0C8A|nr:cytochrome P450 2G1-like [Rhinatrema bivittatum]
MDLSVVFAFIAVCICCILIQSIGRKMYRKGNLPPGPTPFPIIGNLFQIKSGEMVQSFKKLQEEYGPVFTVYLGNRPLVVVCGYQAVKEAFIDQGDVFFERGNVPALERILQRSGVGMLRGEKWKEIRAFSIKTLKDLGMGKRNFEEKLKEEAQCLVEEFRKTKQLPVDPSSYLSQATSNIICSVVFGMRFDYGDKEWVTILNNMKKSFHIMGTFWGQVYDIIPKIMCYLPGPHNQMFRLMHGLTEFISQRVKQNHETLDPSYPRDFSDYFLIRMEKEKENPSSEFFVKNLLMTILDIFIGGVETTSTTLKYGLLILLKHPEIEEKIHEEIDSVVGRNHSSSSEDRRKLHYTNAVIHEIQRFIDVLPMGGIHSVVRDTQFRGYTIPKGTDVCMFLSSVLSDPKYFRDPENFNPGHFLDENGEFKANDAFVPFSMGKRNCLGLGIAQMELFLIFTTVLQNFSLKPVLQPKEIDLKPATQGFETIAPFYELSFLPR